MEATRRLILTVRAIEVLPIPFPYWTMLTSAAFLANGILYVTTPDNWRSLDGLILASLEAPNLVEGSDILRFNLSKTGVPLTGVTALKVEPAIRRRVKKTFRIDAWAEPKAVRTSPMPRVNEGRIYFSASVKKVPVWFSVPNALTRYGLDTRYQRMSFFTVDRPIVTSLKTKRSV